MDKLPIGWLEINLSQIGQWGSGGTPKATKKEYYSGSIPWAKIGDLNDGFVFQTKDYITEAGLINSSAKLVEPGTLLVAMYGSIGKLGVAGVNLATNQAIAFCKVFEQFVMRDFVFYYLRHKREHLLSIGQGGTQQNISQTILKSYPILLPPLNEQKRIVAKLDRLFAHSRRAREELTRIPQLIDRYKKAILNFAVLGRMTQKWREYQKLPDMKTIKLSEVTLGFSYGSSAKSHSSGLVPVLRMGNIQDGLLDWSDLVYTSDALEIKKYSLQQGDVLFNRTNSPELVGKTALYKDQRHAIYAGYLIRIRCSSSLLPEFLTYILNSPIGRYYCWQVKTDGVSQSNINAKKLGNFIFDLPCIEEQKEIVRRVEKLFKVIDTIAAEYQQAIKRLDRLDQAILAKAFRGELVPQDPTDEPAAALLARIQAEKLTQPKPAKAKRKPKVTPDQNALSL